MKKAKAKKEPKITAKEAKFIEEYLLDFNGTKAAKRAGYKQRRPDQMAYELLRKPEIRKIIKERLAERARNYAVTAENTLQELARLAYFDPIAFFDEAGNLKPIHQIEEGARRAISSIETRLEGARRDGAEPALITKIRFSDKTRNLDLLMRHFGLLLEKSQVEITGKDGRPLKIEMADEAAVIKAVEERFLSKPRGS